MQKVALVSKGIIQGGIGRTGCLELCVALQPLLEIEPNQKEGGGLVLVVSTAMMEQMFYVASNNKMFYVPIKF